MVAVMTGGEEPDPHRPGKYRPATVITIECETARDAYRRARDRALAKVDEQFDGHPRLVRWGRNGEPDACGGCGGPSYQCRAGWEENRRCCPGCTHDRLEPR